MAKIQFLCNSNWFETLQDFYISSFLSSKTRIRYVAFKLVLNWKKNSNSNKNFSKGPRNSQIFNFVFETPRLKMQLENETLFCFQKKSSSSRYLAIQRWSVAPLPQLTKNSSLCFEITPAYLRCSCPGERNKTNCHNYHPGA